LFSLLVHPQTENNRRKEKKSAKSLEEYEREIPFIRFSFRNRRNGEAGSPDGHHSYKEMQCQTDFGLYARSFGSIFCTRITIAV
jgi:hypothetical protein